MSATTYAIDDIDRTMLRLRSCGLSYSAISVVLAEYHGWRLNTDNVRNRCRKLGAPPADKGRIADRRATEVPA